MVVIFEMNELSGNKGLRTSYTLSCDGQPCTINNIDHNILES